MSPLSREHPNYAPRLREAASRIRSTRALSSASTWNSSYQPCCLQVTSTSRNSSRVSCSERLRFRLGAGLPVKIDRGIDASRHRRVGEGLDTGVQLPLVLENEKAAAAVMDTVKEDAVTALTE